MKHPLPDRRYTYSEYLTWDTWDGLVEDRYELIDGVPHLLERSYSAEHQTILGNLAVQIANQIKGKQSRILMAPFDVRLNPYTKDNTVVQPDIIAVCDRSKFDEKSCVGAPDLAIEILSPVTARRDTTLKLQLYQDAGVREYWIVDPETQTIYIYLFESGRYCYAAYKDADFVYAKNWSSYSDYGKILCEDLAWTCNTENMSLTNNAKFMHCLPVRRNLVVSDEVIDSPNSIVIEEAANRVVSAQTVLWDILRGMEF